LLKDDVVQPSLPQDEVLANAPQRDGDYFKVKIVLE
jgi:Asp-tRNA(Asn)/Glu-tRNA(Gln) amidotransferase C subunit